MELKHHGPFRRKNVQSYLSFLSKKREGSIYDSTVCNILEKSGYTIPHDPASVYDPDQLWTQLERYAVAPPKLVRSASFLSGVARAYRAFGHRGHSKLNPLVSELDLKNAIKLDKSAGIYQSSKLEAWDMAFTKSKEILEMRCAPNPCLVGVRTQRNNKTRLVWMYPLDITILEATFARPLIEKFKQITCPMPYAKYRIEIGARMAYSLTARNKVGLDFSKFDSSPSAELIQIAFSILETWFELDDEMRNVWNIVKSYFIHTPIVMHDGNLYKVKHHGVPSGSYFTQLIDSVINYIIVTSAMTHFDLHPHERNIFVLGDDSVFSTNEDINLNLLKTYFKGLGFNLNVDKSLVSKDKIHFIGFDWNRGCTEKPLEKVISIMTQPEKWRKKAESKAAEATRSLRLISEVSSLGVNLYEVYYQVFKATPLSINFVTLGEGNSSGYLDFIKSEYDVPNFWRCAASSVFV